MAKVVKIGVIGLGWPGNEHLKGYQTTRKVKVVALCDLNRELLAEKAQTYDVPETYTNYRKMLRDADIDAVDVCVPNDLHMPLTLDALKAGKHVLCEKPPARCAAEAVRMAAAAKKARRTLMYALCMRFNYETVAIKREADAGRLGDVYFARAVYRRRRGIPIGANAWFVSKRRAGGGALIDIGVHALDRAWYLLGSPKPTSVSGVAYSKFKHTVPKGIAYNVDDSAFAMIKFANGAVLLLEASWALNQRGGSALEIAGTKGGAELGPTFFTDRGGKPVDLTPKLKPNNMFAEEVKHFADCILRRRKPMPNADQGIGLMKMLDAIYTSAKTGREVRIR